MASRAVIPSDWTHSEKAGTRDVHKQRTREPDLVLENSREEYSDRRSGVTTIVQPQQCWRAWPQGGRGAHGRWLCRGGHGGASSWRAGNKWTVHVVSSRSDMPRRPSWDNGVWTSDPSASPAMRERNRAGWNGMGFCIAEWESLMAARARRSPLMVAAGHGRPRDARFA